MLECWGNVLIFLGSVFHYIFRLKNVIKNKEIVNINRGFFGLNNNNNNKFDSS